MTRRPCPWLPWFRLCYNQKERFASELADVICCILIISANENIDIEEAVCKCMLKNAKRAYGDGDKL